MTDDDLAYNFGLEVRYAIASAGVDPIHHIPEVDEIIKRRIQEIRLSTLTNTSGDDEAPVAWTSKPQLDAMKRNPSGNHIMWGEPLPYHADIPLFARPQSAAVRDGWQPIETAPKDGTVIQAWHSVHQCPMSVLWKDEGFPFNGERLNWYERSYTTAWPERAFSHWTPLPAAPALHSTQEG